MSRTARLPTVSKKKRYASKYAQGGLNVRVDTVTATATAQNKPKIKIAATGDKFNSYKTRIT